MKIKSLTKDMIDEAIHFVSAHRFQPYKEYEIEDDRFAEFTKHVLSELSSGGENLVLAAEEGARLVGILTLKKLAWDTDFFGMDMFDIDHIIAGESDDKHGVASRLIQSMLKRLRERNGGIPHISVRINTEDIPTVHELERHDFKLMTTLVTYSFDVAKQKMIDFDAPCVLRDFTATDIQTLRQISRDSFTSNSVATNRFVADASLPRDRVERLYSAWVENSCRGLADKVIVAESDGRPIAFTTCKLNPSTGKFLNKSINSMVLSAVSSASRTRGVYTNMINAGLEWLYDKSDAVEVGTEVGNFPVQKAWTKLGFKIIRSQYALARAPQVMGGNSRDV